MIELVAGGVRSGKSRHALARAETLGTRRVFLATAEAGDDEMAARIARHRAERGADWRLVEEPRQLADRVGGFAPGEVVLLDCLGMWVTNWLCSSERDGWPHERERFVSALGDSSAHWILVGNECGAGVVPADRLSREFVDELGTLQQRLAALADRVTLLTLGIARDLKAPAHG